MSLIDSLKEKIEDFWFGILDKYDGLCDKYGKRKVQAVILIIVLLLFAGVFLLFSGTTGSQQIQAKFIFQDETGKTLDNITVAFSIEGQKSVQKTDADGAVSLLVWLNDSVSVKVNDLTSDGIDLEGINETVVVTDTSAIVFVLKEKAEFVGQKTLLLENVDGSQPKPNAIARLKCSNQALNSWEENSIDGVVEIVVPLNCGKVTAVVDSDEFERNSTIFNEDEVEKVLRLSGKEIETGSLDLRIENAQGRLIVDTDFAVTITGNGDSRTEYSNYYGSVLIDNLIPGTYNLSIRDASNNYGLANLSNITVYANDSIEETVVVSKTVKGVLEINVVDDLTSAVVEDAIVIVKDSFGNNFGEGLTDETGKIEFAFKDAGTYEVWAKKPGGVEAGYFPSNVLVSNIDSSIEIALTKITSENSGFTQITVVDELGEPVKNAKAMFLTEKENAVLELASEQNYVLTDANGIAEFTLGQVDEKVYPFVLKFPAQASTPEDAKMILLEEKNYFDITLVIGNAVLEMTALDEDFSLIKGASFEVFDSFGESVTGVIPMDSGQTTYELRADKEIYVVFYHDDFTNYQTTPFQLYPDNSYPVHVTMKPRVFGENPIIEMKGIYNNNVRVNSIEAGVAYQARFSLIVPEGTDFDRAGMHFRIGNKIDVDDEPAFIKDVKAGGFTGLIKGETFNQLNNGEEDLTVGSAKWIEVEWSNPDSREYEIAFDFRVREQTLPATEIPLNYRGYLVSTSGEFFRTPEDFLLEKNESVSAKNGLYADTFTIVFFEGMEPDCWSDFCYSGEWMYSLLDELYVLKPYNVLIGANYKLSFVISNDSAKTFADSKMTIKNNFLGIEDTALKIISYKIKNADGIVINGNPNNYLTNEIPIGDFSENENITVELEFVADELKSTGFEVNIISTGKIPFSRDIFIDVLSERDMTVKIQPELIPAYVPNQIEVWAKENDSLPVDEVKIQVKAVKPDRTELFFSAETDKQGRALIDLPELEPGTLITAKGVKLGFGSDVFEAVVSDEIILFDPVVIEAELNTHGQVEKIIKIDFDNIVGIDFRIKSAELDGKFRGLLDLGSMNNYFTAVLGTKIPKLDIVRIDLLKAVLSSNAEYLMESNEKVKGELTLVVENQEKELEYTFVLPVEIDLKLAGMPVNSPCIIIEGLDVPRWETATQGNKASTSFTIENTCRIEGNLIDADELVAKLEWGASSPKAGTIELTLTAPSGETTTEVLQPNMWVPFFKKTLSSEKGIYNGIITFTPKQGYVGKTAKFDVLINSKINTGTGIKYAGADPSLIDSEIAIINLEQCIKFSNNAVVYLDERSESEDFDVDVSDCGGIPILLEFCKDDPDCKGGTTEGGIFVTDEMRFSGNETQKTGRVSRKLVPGIYGITVHASTPNTSARKVAVIDAILEAQKGSYFELDKYEFELMGEGSKDQTILTNNLFWDNVAVTAGKCAWGDAVYEGFFGKYANKVSKSISNELSISIPTDWVAVIIDVGLEILGLIDDPCDDMVTKNVFDCAICLTNDSRDVYLENGGMDFDIAWNLKEQDITTDGGRKEHVGLMIENVSGFEKEVPIYDVAVINAVEHIHDDPTHRSPRVFMGKNSNFAAWDLPDSSSKIHTQKFHIKLKTAHEVQELPVLQENAYNCYSDTLIGHTGEGILPETKMNWGWGNSDILWNTCDVDNPDSIYCDATQFSIALSKRMKLLEDFLKENDYSFACPDNPSDEIRNDQSDSFNATNSSQIIPNGAMGLSSINYALVDNRATVNVILENKTLTTQSASINISITGPMGYSKSCTKEVLMLNADNSETISCSFNDVPQTAFDDIIATTRIITSTTSLIVNENLQLMFYNPPGATNYYGCWMQNSTKITSGYPAIEFFMNKQHPISDWRKNINQGNVVWTNEIPDALALRNLLHFRAKLMQDAYTDDFQQDFAQFYSNSSFYDAPSWFSGDSSWELSKYFANTGLMKFTSKYYESSKLSGPGIYDISLAIDFTDDWQLFDVSGNPKASIAIKWMKVDSPYPESPFYYLPFDGLVGLDSVNGRQGYGVSFVNVNKEIQLTNTPTNISTRENLSSNALIKTKIEVESGIESLNSRAFNRGRILEVISGDETEITFSPSYATPVVMKISQEKTENPFSVYFKLIENEQPRIVGNNLSYWTGYGSCLDFSNLTIKEAFNFKSDRKATIEDKSLNWFNEYALDWSKAEKGGDVYLYSLFYTPVDLSYSLISDSPNVSFMTPDEIFSQNINLSGISSMPNNNQITEQRIRNLNKIFELVKQEKICVTNTGIQSIFWWNPKTILETQGNQISVWNYEKTLNAGQNCIGYN